MEYRQYYTDSDYDRINYMITILGEKGRFVKRDYVLDLTEQKFPIENKSTQEKHLHYDSMMNWLVDDIKLLKANNTLIGLTEQGIQLYEKQIKIGDHIKQLREEKRLAIKQMRLEIIHKIVLIAISIFTLLSSIASYFVSDLWHGILKTTSNIFCGALIAIVFQLVKPIRDLIYRLK